MLAWGNAKDSILKKNILLQKRALRYIHNSGYNSHTDPLFQHSGILKLEFKYRAERVWKFVVTIVIDNKDIWNSYKLRNVSIPE